MQIRIISPLEKIFDDVAELQAPAFKSTAVARGEICSFQIAVKEDGDERGYIRVVCESALNVRIRTVDSVPVHLAADTPDDDYLRTTPGLYPDLLSDLEDCDTFRILTHQRRMLWVTIPVPEECRPGRYAVRFRFSRMVEEEWTPCAEAEFEVEVTPFSLPEQELIRYEWFHADALCSCYRVAAWSEEHWEIVERFACNAVRHGINALYTPLWTPPLDTEVNGERPTCQLLDIAYDPATRSYRFDFGKLERFLDMGLRLGFKKFGMSHLFTQWGAKFTPKIICTLPDGREEKRFGWHVAADDPSYAEFLRALLPKLIAFFRKKGIAERCFFSISDEPCEEQKESYSRAVNLARPLLEGIPTVEALSRIEFYEAGLVQHPVPSCNILESFQGRVKDLWTYYCCGQQQQTPNRFMAMPSARVRIMGMLAYVYDLAGFLQWGFNFYYAQYSRKPIDPFACTDAGGAFPAGDPFLVYPGSNGEPLDSIRHEVFRDGLQDLRALKLLEQKIGREAVLGFLKQGRTERFTMTDYPRDPEYLLELRPRIYAELAKA